MPLLVQFPFPAWATRPDEVAADRRNPERLPPLKPPRCPLSTLNCRLDDALPPHLRLAHRQATPQPQARRRVRGRPRGGARHRPTARRSTACSSPATSSTRRATARGRAHRLRLLRASSSATGIPAVVIAGNHDHPRRMNAFARVLDLVNVHVRGEPVVADEGGVIEVSSPRRHGDRGHRRAALGQRAQGPRLRVADDGGEHFEQYAEGVAGDDDPPVHRLPRGHRQHPASPTSSSQDAKVGGPRERRARAPHGRCLRRSRRRCSRRRRSTSRSATSTCRRTSSCANAHYCGSLLQCDFGEAGQEKRVNIVDVTPGRKAKVEHVPLQLDQAAHEHRLPQGGRHPRRDRRRSDRIAGDAYVKVFLKVDAPGPRPRRAGARAPPERRRHRRQRTRVAQEADA